MVVANPAEFPCGPDATVKGGWRTCGKCDPVSFKCLPLEGDWFCKPLGDFITSCPRRAMSPWSIDMLYLYEHYENGNLLVAGGVLDQPAVYLEAMTILDRVFRTDWSKR